MSERCSAWAVVALGVALSLAGEVLAGGRRDGIAKFAFGPPESVLRAGFTRVTAKDAFTPEKGHGFESVRGLLAFDRGGSKIELPKDQYTASVYGAYRMTSDLTAALIEGQGDNAFLMALPDGDYTVWLIASDANWDPPLFEVWANGEKKLDARIPRARFVFMEPFHARAADGRLRIELKGPHGWVLSGLVVGKDGPELAATIAALERDIFFLTEPELPKWREVKPAHANPPLEWTAEEKQRGYVVFPVDYTEQVVPTSVPARAAIGKPLTAFATPGEFEPATFCLSAQKDLGRVAVEVSDFVGEGNAGTIAGQSVRVGVVRCAPQRLSSWGGDGEYRVVPTRIEPPIGRAGHVNAGETRQWWLTAQVPKDTPAGRYRMSLTVRPESAPPTTLEWRLRVLPFQLTRPVDRHWGTWLDHFPPIGGARGPERRGRNVQAEIDRVAQADVADFRDHGFDLVLLNYYFGVKENPDGSFTYGLSTLPQDLDRLRMLGSNAPVVICFEYTCRNIEYRFAEPGRHHVPGTFSPKARKAIVGLVTFLRDEARRRGWPRLLFFPIDEPGNNKTLNRMLFAETVLDLVHEVPGCQTATTVTASCVQRLRNRVDVRIYAYGHYHRSRVLAEVAQGHPFWYYENGIFYGRNTLASRGGMGLEFLRSGAEAATAWGFAATQANPHNDFDGGHKDWNVLFPGVDGPTPTIYWELCREGVDDCRYVATLQKQVQQARQAGKTEAAQRAERVLAPLLDPDARPIDRPLAFGRYRWRIAREILSLTGDGEALSFAAVAGNQAAPEKVGPNVIANPSFEDGPQADGFPGGGYHIADPYSKPDQKPVGALAVAEGEAHTGRYALKWDFSKAAGKGSVYEGNHYLIVNVQVPREAAKALRGHRIKVGYWFRLGGGPLVPGMVLRQFGAGKFLGGIEYKGGVQDPSVWNHFEAGGRLRSDFEGLDVHISCRVPDDAELAKKSLFLIDDVSLQAIEEPPLAVTTPLDEYYAGERIPWTVSAASARGQIKIELLQGDRPIAGQTGQAGQGALRGTFETRGLTPGIYTLHATLRAPDEATKAAGRHLILAPDPFDWPPPPRSGPGSARP